MEKVKDGKYANIQEEWRETVECRQFDKFDDEGCGAEYVVEPADLVLRYFKGTHSKHYYTAMRCEQCDKYTRVYDIPEMVLKAIYTAKNIKKATFDGFSDE